MMTEMNKEAAFASIVADLELFFPLLATPDKAMKLTTLSNIGDKLVAANLTWRDVAERLAAPLPAKATDTPPCAPPPFYPPAPPRAELDPAIAVVTAGLTAQFGYRDRGDVAGMARPSPEATHRSAFAKRPGETDAEAGQRLAKWALTEAGVIFHENPETGALHPPGWVIPGLGKVQPDGTLSKP